MNGQHLLTVLQDPKQPVAQRLDAARQLAREKKPEVAGPLAEFLQRPMPPAGRSVNYDPSVEERCCRIAAIGVLEALGNHTHQSRLVDYVDEATGGPHTFPRETDVAADVIIETASSKLVKKVIDLSGCSRLGPEVNAIRTLEAIQFPQPATHPPLALALPQLTNTSATLTPKRMRPYFDALVAASKGSITLSHGTQIWLDAPANDYPISDGSEDEVELKNFLESELNLNGLTYYAQNRQAVVCTAKEASAQWAQWWAGLGKTESERGDAVRSMLNKRQAERERAAAAQRKQTEPE